MLSVVFFFINFDWRIHIVSVAFFFLMVSTFSFPSNLYIILIDEVRQAEKCPFFFVEDQILFFNPLDWFSLDFQVFELWIGEARVKWKNVALYFLISFRNRFEAMSKSIYLVPWKQRTALYKIEHSVGKWRCSTLGKLDREIWTSRAETGASSTRRNPDMASIL